MRYDTLMANESYASHVIVLILRYQTRERDRQACASERR